MILTNKPIHTNRETVGCILKYNSKYLLLHRTKDHTWESLAGSIIKGERPYHAVLREIKEELNLDLKPLFFRTTYHDYRGTVVAYHIFYYIFDTNPLSFITLNWESFAADLFTLEEVHRLDLYEDEVDCLALFDTFLHSV